MDWNVVIATGGAVALGALRLLAYWIRVRAVMNATPEQRAALDKIDPPLFIRSAGPPIVMLGFAGAMAAGPHVTGIAQDKPKCTPQTCKPPARCTVDGCNDAARPHGAVDGDPAWAGVRTAWDGRPQWIGDGS